eukprot:CAMPEP_0203822116 /NCGR_PEP_ID=MMETSP0115-20131106/45283_1 /ASSEMBLY_ACC=CAM_ASM_000227 /TAXON_ID=33651 /ORGANISM="Bicosoecid sp, Strain ms1" /LENGTH=338 /DNA_ID=CAMNT_0050731147 /DNA_START=76 /DNA_END=1088 /DNA_ORIENTATION=-
MEWELGAGGHGAPAVPPAGAPVPAGRWGHSLTAVGPAHMVLFGGLAGGKMYDDTWLLDVATGRWSIMVNAGSPPSGRWGHTATLVGASHIYVLGGRHGSKPLPMNDIYVLDVRSFHWSYFQLPKPAPKNRYAHSTVLLGDGHTLLTFAGHGGRTRYYKDVHLLDTTTNRWYTPVVTGAVPTKRSGHTLARVGDYCFVHGGFNGKEILADISCLDLRTFAWSGVRLAGGTLPPLVGHSCTTVTGTSDMLIFGGSSASSRLSPALYVVAADTLSVAVVHVKRAPAPRFWHACELLGDRLVCFGGSGTKCAAYNDLVNINIGVIRRSRPRSAGGGAGGGGG